MQARHMRTPHGPWRTRRITKGPARCVVGAELAAKYAVPAPNNEQAVCSITNCWTYEQTWYNEVRSNKPQTFISNGPPEDPTLNKGCDFCRWEALTAQVRTGAVGTQGHETLRCMPAE